MTTILADARLGQMITDSLVSDGDRKYPGKKVFRTNGALIGMAGVQPKFAGFLKWYKNGMEGKCDFAHCSALILEGNQLKFFDSNYTEPVVIESGIEAIGTGAKAAMCAYEALGWDNPRRAVSIVCKHDANSIGPVRVYKSSARD